MELVLSFGIQPSTGLVIINLCHSLTAHLEFLIHSIYLQYDEAEKRREMAKNSLERYTHYYERWATNQSVCITCEIYSENEIMLITVTEFLISI